MELQKPKVLINAYACSPDRGSEPGTGWNWCAHLAKHCELFIITEEEFRNNIETTLETLPQAENMHFYYNPVSEEVREMARNQGDWRFYLYYKKWQKRTLDIAKQIVLEKEIDILHQLNMSGFREPGYLWKIKNIPFVWGPIGGLKQFPVAYLKGADIKLKFLYRLKNVINVMQFKYDLRVNRALNHANLLISSIPDSYKAIKYQKKKDSVLINETGSFVTSDVPSSRFYDDDFHVIWVGRFYFRKQLALALKTLATTNNKHIILDVFGKGREIQENEAKQLARDLNIEDQVIWHGHQPHSVVQQAMRKAQLFFFTSVNEDTPNVILEAVSNRLPILCFDTCGFGAIINEKVGRKIPLTTPENSVKEFARHLNMFYSNRQLLEELSKNSDKLQRQLSWDVKANEVVSLYRNLMNGERV